MTSIEANSEETQSQQHRVSDDDYDAKTKDEIAIELNSMSSNISINASNDDQITIAQPSSPSTSALTHQQHSESKSSNDDQFTMSGPSSSITDLEPVPHNSQSNIPTKKSEITMASPSSSSSTFALTHQQPVPHNSQYNVTTKSSNDDQITTADSSSISALNDQESVPKYSEFNVTTSSLNNEQIMTGESSSSISAIDDQESAPFKEETGLTSDLAETEKKALMELKSKITEAILMNTLFEVHTQPNVQPPKSTEFSKGKQQEQEEENGSHGDKGKSKESCEDKGVEIDENISIWGVPLLPSKGDQGTDVILLKFLRAREFKVNETYEMLRSSLQWRKEFNMDSILEEEEFGTEYDSVAYTSGEDRLGHPVCYNIYGAFGDDDMYSKTFGTERGRQKFLRWRLRLMEMEIKKLDFKPGGVSSLLQINDLNNAPGPSKKDIRNVTKEAVQLLQDNYPEFVARNIFVNVPIWYYAFNAMLSPFLTQRTKSKFIFSRPAGVTETLLQYIALEEIPFQYGGFKREKDPHFSTKDGVSEVGVKIASTQTIEIPAPEVGSILVWEVIVLGWEVKYKEEFVPTDEESYTLIVKKERKMGWQQGSLRNTFINKEPGKLVITITNPSFKRKRLLYRHNLNTPSSSSSSS